MMGDGDGEKSQASRFGLKPKQVTFHLKPWIKTNVRPVGQIKSEFAWSAVLPGVSEMKKPRKDKEEAKSEPFFGGCCGEHVVCGWAGGWRLWFPPRSRRDGYKPVRGSSQIKCLMHLPHTVEESDRPFPLFLCCPLRGNLEEWTRLLILCSSTVAAGKTLAALRQH
jgi:hypothetical protein